MKHSTFKQFSLMLLAMFASIETMAFTGDAVVDGIKYNIVTKEGIAKVIKGGNYSGSIVIPDTIEYEGTKCRVYAIDQDAFYYREQLTSITLPETIESIGSSAFQSCSKLTSIVIPDSVKIISNYTFAGCKSLTSVRLPQKLTTIGTSAFDRCTSLESIEIPFSVTTIYSGAFADCSKLKDVKISDLDAWCSIVVPGVSGLTNRRFFYNTWNLILNGVQVDNLVLPKGIKTVNPGLFSCSTISSVTFPESVTKIDDFAFYGCKKLSTLKVTEGIEEIGKNAFAYCDGLESIILPGSLKTIESYAFEGCTEIASVYCYSETCPTTMKYVFQDCGIEYCNLYVPTAGLDAYKATSPWNEFKNILTISGDTPDAKKCDKPVIRYNDGKLEFSSTTEGVNFYYVVTDTDIKQDKGSQVNLSVTYNVKVYATKDGYENSDIAYATLCWIDDAPKTEGVEMEVEAIKARSVMIKASDNTLQISGAPSGCAISVYDISGKMVGSSTANSAITFIPTNLSSGEIAIIKIGNKSVKFVMR